MQSEIVVVGDILALVAESAGKGEALNGVESVL